MDIAKYSLGSGFARKAPEQQEKPLVGSGFTRKAATQPQVATPATREVQKNDMAQHQLEGILKKDSPLMQLSRTQGMQYGNSRGLLNSSISSGAAQNAMIQNAAPIATHDANTHFQQGRANQDATNQFALTKASHQHESGMLDKQQAHQSLMAAQDREFRAGQDAILRDYQAQQNAIEREFQGSQNEAERQARIAELSRQSATELMRQVSGMNATLTDSIAKIQAADINHNNKQSMINNLIEMHYNNLSTTTAMADYDVVDGKVVYIAKGGANQQAARPEPAVPKYPYYGNFYYP